MRKNTPNHDDPYMFFRTIPTPKEYLNDPTINAEVVASTSWIERVKNGKKNISFFFSDYLPKIKISAGKSFREIDVEYSSTEHDNASLLHLLFNKTTK